MYGKPAALLSHRCIWILKFMFLHVCLPLYFCRTKTIQFKIFLSVPNVEDPILNTHPLLKLWQNKDISVPKLKLIIVQHSDCDILSWTVRFLVPGTVVSVSVSTVSFSQDSLIGCPFGEIHYFWHPFTYWPAEVLWS